MKSFGYVLLSIGFSSLVVKVFENISDWKQFMIVFVIIFGLVVVVEGAKEETLKELDEKIERARKIDELK